MNRELVYTNIDWINEMPKLWDLGKVKHLFYRSKNINSVNNPTVLSLKRNGIKVRDISRNEGQVAASYDKYNVVKKKDLLLNPMDLVSGANCNVSYVEGVISPAYVNLRSRKNISSEYYDYYFKLQYWNLSFFAHGKGVSFENRWTLNNETLMNYPIPIPPYEEQKAIAFFLNKKVSKIDAIIEKTTKSIKELKKYKHSLVSETLTKGIDPNVKKKDSGVNWLGEVPKHWDVSKIKNIFEIKKVIANKLGYDVLSVTQEGLKIKNVNVNEGQMSSDYSKYQIVDINDFVMNHMDLITGGVDCSKYFGVTSPDYRVFKFKDDFIEFDHEYFKFLLQICYWNKIFYGYGQGVSSHGRWRLQTNQFLNFYFPVPSIGEQREISNFINQETLKVEKLIEKKEQLINEMDSYKKSLVYEYVTGKKEVT